MNDQTTKERDPATATLDDIPVPDATGVLPEQAGHCTPAVCLLGDKVTDWNGLENFECPKCGRKTTYKDEIAQRRPGYKFDQKKKR